MELFAITKGNFNLDRTKEIRKHENNLRFHVKDENGKFHEFSINSWNRFTLNLRCIHDRSRKCTVKLTVSLGEHLKIQEKICNSKQTKYEWDDKNEIAC